MWNRSGTALAGLTLAALLVRTYRLDGPSFWVDEGWSASLAQTPSFADWTRDVHPPLYYALLSVWGVWSRGDWWLRFFSVLAGVATIPVVYDLGRRLFGRATGLWAAALLSVLAIHVKYSQEARMYALVVLLFACALWGLAVGAREGRPVGWATYTAAATLLLYAHGLAPVYVVTLAVLMPLFARDLRDRTVWQRWLVSNGVAVALFALWLPVYAARAQDVRSGFWTSAARPALPLVSALSDFSVHWIPSPTAMLRSHAGVDPGGILGAWVWTAPVVLVLAAAIVGADRDRRWTVSALMTAYALPMVLLFVLSLAVAPVFLLRALLPAVVPAVLVLGSAADTLSSRRLRNHLGLGVILAIFALGTAYYFRHDTKEQWREASLYLQENARPADILLFASSPRGPFLIGRYDSRGRLSRNRRLMVEDLVAPCGNAPVRCLAEGLNAEAAGRTVWVIHRFWPTIESPEIRTWLAQHLARQSAREFQGVLVEQATLSPSLPPPELLPNRPG